MNVVKRRIKSWCRYWHYNVTGVLRDNEGHSNYLNVISNLDDWHNTNAWGIDDENDLDEAWKIVLQNIGKCNEEQLSVLERLCSTKN